MNRRIVSVLVVALGISMIALSGGCSRNEAASTACRGFPESQCMTCCKANGATSTLTTKVNGTFNCGCAGSAK